MEHVQAVRMNGVCEQCQSLLGDVVKSCGEKRGGDLRAGRKIDSKRNRKVQSGSSGAPAFSSKPNLHQASNSVPAFAWPYRDVCIRFFRKGPVESSGHWTALASNRSDSPPFLRWNHLAGLGRVMVGPVRLGSSRLKTVNLLVFCMLPLLRVP